MKRFDFQIVKIVFSVVYAVLAGMCAEWMGRYLFFTYTRKEIALPEICSLLLIEEVPTPYFPAEYTYFQLIVMPAVVLLGFCAWTRKNKAAGRLIDRAVLLCNGIVTLLFLAYLSVFLYCLHLFAKPELLDPKTCSSWASVVVKYCFIIACLGVVGAILPACRSKSSEESKFPDA